MFCPIEADIHRHCDQPPEPTFTRDQIVKEIDALLASNPRLLPSLDGMDQDVLGRIFVADPAERGALLDALRHDFAVELADDANSLAYQLAYDRLLREVA